MVYSILLYKTKQKTQTWILRINAKTTYIKIRWEKQVNVCEGSSCLQRPHA